ncbi:MAG: N4-gp56 family major capsid protein [Acutalibacteraceae bacterium]|nr:N4-gp56 family major capsid protein [Acutalibacteraceae bacterium]
MNKKMNLQLFDGTANMAATTDTGLAAEIKEYYVKELLENATPKMVHTQFGQKRNIPKGSGKTIEWRKFSQLPPATQPLVEGVTPTGTKRTVTSIKGNVSQYGDYIKHTDVLQTTAFDNVIVEDCKEQGNQAGNTIDVVTRNVLQNCGSVCFAGGKTTRESLTAADKLTVADVKKMVNRLKRRDITTIDGYYVCIIHPDVATDIMLSNEWEEMHKYADTTALFEGEIGKIGKCRFIETSNAAVYKQTTGSKLAVYGTLFLGANAYGVTELEGLGLDYIVKPLGYGDDPLNQRSSTGWKATHCCTLLNDYAIIRFESCSYMSADPAVEANITTV